MSRAISVDVLSSPLRVISVEDVVAYEARLLLNLDASVPVLAKHADDYQQLVGLVESSAETKSLALGSTVCIRRQGRRSRCRSSGGSDESVRHVDSETQRLDRRRAPSGETS